MNDTRTPPLSQVFVCGATQTYYGDEGGWWKYDWLTKTLTRKGSPRVAPLQLLRLADRR